MPSDKDPLLRKTRMTQLCTFLIYAWYAFVRLTPTRNWKGSLLICEFDHRWKFSLSASLCTKRSCLFSSRITENQSRAKWTKRYFLKWSPNNLKRRYQLQLVVSEYYINSNIHHYNGIFNPVTDYLNTLLTDKIKVFKCYRHVLVMISWLPIWISVPFVFICT